jgi:DNA-directed RNA polymerase specialized sigma24 family protein
VATNRTSSVKTAARERARAAATARLAREAALTEHAEAYFVALESAERLREEIEARLAALEADADAALAAMTATGESVAGVSERVDLPVGQVRAALRRHEKASGKKKPKVTVVTEDGNATTDPVGPEATAGGDEESASGF